MKKEVTFQYEISCSKENEEKVEKLIEEFLFALKDGNEDAPPLIIDFSQRDVLNWT